MDIFTSLAITIICPAITMALLLAPGLRVVPAYQRLVVFRLGRIIGQKGPGIVILIPILDRAVKVELREQEQQFQSGALNTKDDTNVIVDLILRYKVVDPLKSVIVVADLRVSLREAVTQILKDLMSTWDYSDTLFKRSQLGDDIRTRLQRTVQDWGIEVSSLELREISKN